MTCKVPLVVLVRAREIERGEKCLKWEDERRNGGARWREKGRGWREKGKGWMEKRGGGEIEGERRIMERRKGDWK